MASIEERLDRSDWDPMPGESIIGVIVDIEVRASKKDQRPYPVLIVKDANGVHAVSCALFASEVIAMQPVPGDRVGVKFHGPQERRDGNGTWDKYTIAFERDEGPLVDWKAMAQARMGTRANGAQPGSRTADDYDPRSYDPPDEPDPEF